jgi:hypothetical protein
VLATKWYRTEVGRNFSGPLLNSPHRTGATIALAGRKHGRNVGGVREHVGRIEALRTGFRHAPVIKDVIGDVHMTVEGVRVKRITLNVDLVEARDLLERVPRACVAFTSDDGPRVEPVTLLFKDDRYLVGMPSSAASHLAVNEEVVLLVDDGVQFFDLRAIYVRGDVQPLGGVEGLGGDFFWFEVQPTRTVAWDYARMREVDNES